MIRRAGLAALAYAVLAVLWGAPSTLAPTESVPDLGDPLHLGWIMAWDAHQIVRKPWALFESNSFYPYPHSLAFADHLLPEALLVAPVFWITGNAVLAYNIAVVLALTLSALALFLLARAMGLCDTAAFVGGLVYAFNRFTLHEVARVHVLSVQWWPLALVFLDRFVREGRGRDAAALALFLLLQGLSGTYYLVYTLLLAPFTPCPIGRKETVAAIALGIGYPHEEFGRNLVLIVDAGDGAGRRVPYDDGPAERLATLNELLDRPREARMVLRIEPQPVRRLRVMVGLREEDPAWPRWSVAELRLFAACR